jgi:hypothetical protein
MLPPFGDTAVSDTMGRHYGVTISAIKWRHSSNIATEFFLVARWQIGDTTAVDLVPPFGNKGAAKMDQKTMRTSCLRPGATGRQAGRITLVHT